jgi:hypothetical protein
MRILLLSCLLLSPPAFAGLGETFAIDVFPNPARSDATIAITVTPLAPLCAPLSQALFLQNPGDNVLRVDLGGSDVCEGSFADPQQYVLGPLAAGNYTLRFVRCNGLPVPGGECAIVEERALTVFGVSQSPAAVPSLSNAGVALATSLLALIGVLAATRRER